MKPEFIHRIDTLRGLTANKDYTRFHYRCKVFGKTYTKTIDYTSQKAWTPAVRKKEAVKEANSFKEEKQTGVSNVFTPSTKVDLIADEYFDKKCRDTEWTKARRILYENYIQPFIGKRPIKSVTENAIDTIRKNMETTNFHQYKKGGNSIRSQEKVLFQTLKPILEYAKSNGAIDRLPNITIPGRTTKNQRKKKVKAASEKFVTLYNAILTRYKDDAFYRALFLFALNGRRWGEIKSLHWESIDFEDNTYTVEAEYNKIGEDQVYSLPLDIRTALEEMLSDKKGLVFKSPRTGKMLDSPRKQLAKIKADTGIEALTMHYFRHILVTTLGEHGMAATSLSAALGHTRSETVDAHYRTINHLKGSQDAVEHLGVIVGGGK